MRLGDSQCKQLVKWHAGHVKTLSSLAATKQQFAEMVHHPTPTHQNPHSLLAFDDMVLKWVVLKWMAIVACTLSPNVLSIYFGPDLYM